MTKAGDDFTERLCIAIMDAITTDDTRGLIERAIVDTLAVAAAGFAEPDVRKCEAVFSGAFTQTWSGAACESVESAILLNGIAAHALDFDDLLPGGGHLSAVIVPALLSGAKPLDSGDFASAYAAGLLTGRAVGRRIGPGLNKSGWHPTGVLGAIAAAAAVGRLRRLDPRRLRWALSLAAAQAGGLRANFGTMGKPSHAGFAAAAGYRAVRMAEAGIDGASDVFCAGGFADLYGAGDGDPFPPEDFLVPRPERIIVKLYPCCYASHRLISGALQLRRAFGAERFRDPDLRIEVAVPPGMKRSLLYDHPRTGLEAKFSAIQPIAIALIDGVPGIDHFTDETTQRSDLRTLAERICVTEYEPAAQDANSASLPVRFTVKGGDTVLSRLEVIKIPGSPDDPPSYEAMRQKIADCFRVFERSVGSPYPMHKVIQETSGLSDWIP